MYQEPVFYIAVDDASYEKLFPSDSNEAEKAAGSEEAVESDGYDTGGDTDSRYTDGDNQKENASGAEQAAEEAVDARDWQTLTPSQQTEVLKQTLLEYFRLEAGNVQHPFFYSTAFRNILEEHVYFSETFKIITGVSLQDFYQQKEYKDLTYQQLLELYVYADMIDRGQIPFYRSIAADGVPILKKMGLNSDAWRMLYQNTLHHFFTGTRKRRAERNRTGTDRKKNYCNSRYVSVNGKRFVINYETLFNDLKKDGRTFGLSDLQTRTGLPYYSIQGLVDTMSIQFPIYSPSYGEYAILQ